MDIPDIVTEIIKHLPLDDIISISQVNKMFYQLTQDIRLWYKSVNSIKKLRYIPQTIKMLDSHAILRSDIILHPTSTPRYYIFRTWMDKYMISVNHITRMYRPIDRKQLITLLFRVLIYKVPIDISLDWV